MRLNCTAAGSAGRRPPPTVRWYHNGHAVRPNSIVRLLNDGGASSSDLEIRSFDPVHQGMYQCVAETAAGERQASALLTLSKEAETMLLPRLRSVTCYPFNATAYLIGFETSTKIVGLLVFQVNGNTPAEQWTNGVSMRGDGQTAAVQHGAFVVSSWWQPYRPFGVHVRGMQTIGHKIVEDHRTDIIALTPMSAEVACAIQGCKLWWATCERVVRFVSLIN